MVYSVRANDGYDGYDGCDGRQSYLWGGREGMSAARGVGGRVRLQALEINEQARLKKCD